MVTQESTWTWLRGHGRPLDNPANRDRGLGGLRAGRRTALTIECREADTVVSCGSTELNGDGSVNVTGLELGMYDCRIVVDRTETALRHGGGGRPASTRRGSQEVAVAVVPAVSPLDSDGEPVERSRHAHRVDSPAALLGAPALEAPARPRSDDTFVEQIWRATKPRSRWRSSGTSRAYSASVAHMVGTLEEAEDHCSTRSCRHFAISNRAGSASWNLSRGCTPSRASATCRRCGRDGTSRARLRATDRGLGRAGRTPHRTPVSCSGDLRELPEDQRAALLLSQVGDLSHAEMADVLGCELVNVKALVFRARSAPTSAAR
jgi:hypothetical protein